MVTLFRKKAGNVEVELPQTWRVLQTIFKGGREERALLGDLINHGLEHPVDSRRLEDMLKPGTRVAIVVDDLTRPTPVREILPPLLKRIHGCGVSEADIDLVIGVGTHRPLTEGEIRIRVGDEIAKKYRVTNHDARSSDLVRVGEVEGYGAVSMNRTVIRADVKVTVGSILPHPHNGFGGGPKNVMPGICDFETIRRHHLKNIVHPRSILGNVFENPFYDHCRKIAGLAGVDFCVSCLYDGFGKVSGVLAGAPLSVHEAGIREAKEATGIPVSEKTDVTLVSSYPYNEGPQIVKPILPAAMVTRPGGTIFLLAEISAPLPSFFLDSLSKVREGGEAMAEARIRENLSRHVPLMEGPMDFNMALALIFFVSTKFRVVLVADRVLQGAASTMGFEYASDLAGALAEEKGRTKNATVHVIPAGGYIFPIVPEGFRLMDE